MPVRRRLTGAVVGGGGIPLVTLALLRIEGHADLSTALLSYLTLTMVVATIGGVWPSLPTAVAGYAAAKWFFTPPFRTWVVDRGQDLLALAVFLGVAVLVSLLVHLVARRAAEAQRARTAAAADAARAALLAEGNRLRTALLSAVSHDLRTPLATIKAWLTGLLEGDVRFSPEDVDEILTAAVAEVDRLNALVGNLLDMSRLQTGAVQVHSAPVALDTVTAAVLATLPHEGRLHVDIPDDLPPVHTDAALLERVVANLVDNALRHTPGDSAVDLQATAATDDGVELRVVDHGPGIRPERRDRLFEPFQRHGDRSNTVGVGLGLAVAKGLTDALQADLVAEDTRGGGTTMLLRLPVAP